MGIRLVIGVFIAILLGAGAYFAQQSYSTKNLLEEARSALSGEEDRSRNMEQQIQDLRTRLAEATASIGKQAEEIRATLEAERKARAQAEAAGKRNLDLANERAEQIARLEKAGESLRAQMKAMNLPAAEKSAPPAPQSAQNQGLEDILARARAALAAERKARAQAETEGKRNLARVDDHAREIARLEESKEILEAQVEEMSHLVAEKISVTDLIRKKLDRTKMSLAETVREHTSEIARSKVLAQRARAEAARSKKLESDLAAMNTRLQEPAISTQRGERGAYSVSMINKLLFPTGSAGIKEGGYEALARLADFLKHEKGRAIQVRVEGHADDRPIAGELALRYPTNWELSFARAVAVIKFLEEKGISPERLSATAYSFHRPVVSNTSEEQRAKNRRIVVLLEGAEDDVPPQGAPTKP